MRISIIWIRRSRYAFSTNENIRKYATLKDNLLQSTVIICNQPDDNTCWFNQITFKLNN